MKLGNKKKKQIDKKKKKVIKIEKYKGTKWFCSRQNK